MFYCGNVTRFPILLLATFCLSLSCANYLALNFTIICMHRPGTNDTEPMFTPSESNLLFSGVAIGSLIGSAIVVTPLTSMLGLRWLLTIFGFLSTAATLFTPLATRFGVYPVLLARIFQGAPLATSLVAVGAIACEWGPLSESGLFLAVVSSHLQFGPILTMPLAGELCESPKLGWPGLYYIQGTVSLVCFIAFFIYFRDSPSVQRNVSAKELAKIQQGKNPEHSMQKNQKIPYLKIFSDRIVWVNVGTMFCVSVAFQTFAVYGPTYLSKAMGYAPAKTGFSAAFPYLLSLIAKIVVGPLADRLTFLGDKARVAIFASLSMYGMAVCYLGMALLPLFGVNSRFLIQCFFTGVTMFSGINTVGVTLSIQLIARQYSSVLFTCYQIQCGICILILPLVVDRLVPDNTIHQWSILYIGVGVIVFLGVTVFVLTNDINARPWTFTKLKHLHRVVPLTPADISPNKIDGDAKKSIDLPADDIADVEEANEKSETTLRRFRAPTVEGMSIN